MTDRVASLPAPAVVPSFGALRHHDYRWYFTTSVLAMMADSIEHVISVRTAVVCAWLWAVMMGLFPLVSSYGLALLLLTLAGVFNITFTAMAQTLVQVLAPAPLRGRVVGLFNTATLGLRAGSGVTVGLLGAVIDVRWSLALSSAAVLATAVGLLLLDISYHSSHGSGRR